MFKPVIVGLGVIAAGVLCLEVKAQKKEIKFKKLSHENYRPEPLLSKKVSTKKLKEQIEEAVKASMTYGYKGLRQFNIKLFPVSIPNRELSYMSCELLEVRDARGAVNFKKPAEPTIIDLGQYRSRFVNLSDEKKLKSLQLTEAKLKVTVAVPTALELMKFKKEEIVKGTVKTVGDFSTEITGVDKSKWEQDRKIVVSFKHKFDSPVGLPDAVVAYGDNGYCLRTYAEDPSPSSTELRILGNPKSLRFYVPRNYFKHTFEVNVSLKHNSIYVSKQPDEKVKAQYDKDGKQFEKARSKPMTAAQVKGLKTEFMTYKWEKVKKGIAVIFPVHYPMITNLNFDVDAFAEKAQFMNPSSCNLGDNYRFKNWTDFEWNAIHALYGKILIHYYAASKEFNLKTKRGARPQQIKLPDGTRLNVIIDRNVCYVQMPKRKKGVSDVKEGIFAKVAYDETGYPLELAHDTHDEIKKKQYRKYVWHGQVKSFKLIYGLNKSTHIIPVEESLKPVDKVAYQDFKKRTDEKFEKKYARILAKPDKKKRRRR